MNLNRGDILMYVMKGNTLRLVDDTESLKHHGVLGMRWGIRRYQPYPTGKYGTFLGLSRDEDIKIPKGTKAVRTQHGSGDIDKNGKPLHVSFDKLDTLTMLSNEGSTNKTDSGKHGLISFEDGNNHIVNIQMTNDIIAPSYKKTMDAFIKTAGTIGVKNMSKDMGELGKDFVKNCKKLDEDYARNCAYMAFASTLLQDSKAKHMFFDILKKEGYNAVLDENDNRFGSSDLNSSVIIFDRNDVKKESSYTIPTETLDYFSDIVANGITEATNKHHKGERSLKKWAGDETWNKWIDPEEIGERLDGKSYWHFN